MGVDREVKNTAGCPVCGESMASLDDFERHLARRHGQIPRPRRRVRRGWFQAMNDILFALPWPVYALPGLLVGAVYDNAVGFATTRSPNPIWGYVTFAMISTAALWFWRMTMGPSD